MNHNEIHYQFIDIAGGISQDLTIAIEKVGPVKFEADHSKPLAHYMCESVTSQQLSVKVADTIWNRVLKESGSLPLTEFFVEENRDIMRGCGLSAAKVKTMCGIAQMAREGELDEEHLRSISHKERSKHLMVLWGVGQWTVDMISIFYFGDEDVWPDGDLAARKTLEKLTGRRRKTVRTAQHFAPYRSRLALYMWGYKEI
ncbi:MAG: hypothetical protein WDZ38_08410 [Balneolaceae bacterium]